MQEASLAYVGDDGKELAGIEAQWIDFVYKQSVISQYSRMVNLHAVELKILEQGMPANLKTNLTTCTHAFSSFKGCCMHWLHSICPEHRFTTSQGHHETLLRARQ